MSIIYTILIFGAIIFIHELGHFIVAKLCNVKIREFALGMGPTIAKIRGKETLYSLRLFPIGGYVSMEGENEESEDERAFNKKSSLKKIAICSAGAIMNLVLGFVIILCTLIGDKVFTTTTIAKFKEDAISPKTGLMVNDTIVKMNGSRVYTDRDVVFEALRDDDGIITMTVKRDGEKVELPDVAFKVEGEGEKRSIYLDFVVYGEKPTVLNTVSYAFKSTFSLARNSWKSVIELFTGKVSLMDLSGPVGVGKVVGEAAKFGAESLFNLMAFISISVGMFNLIPFPALDGGQIVIFAAEGITRKKISETVKGYINLVGLILLFGLMIVVTAKDIITLF